MLNNNDFPGTVLYFMLKTKRHELCFSMGVRVGRGLIYQPFKCVVVALEDKVIGTVLVQKGNFGPAATNVYGWKLCDTSIYHHRFFVAGQIFKTAGSQTKGTFQRHANRDICKV